MNNKTKDTVKYKCSCGEREYMDETNPFLIQGFLHTDLFCADCNEQVVVWREGKKPEDIDILIS